MSTIGYLQARAYTSNAQIPLRDVAVVVTAPDQTAIAMRVTANVPRTAENLVTLALSALVAGLTVGGKAIGKTYAIKSCTAIVHRAGRVIAAWHDLTGLFRKKRNR